MKKIIISICAVIAAMMLMVGCSANANAATFVDVAADSWYASSVDYVVENGLFEGTAATVFSPDLSMTRGMLMTVLYRAAGSPEVTTTTAFADVAAAAWYNKAVSWAVSHQIAGGVGADKFAPNEAISREQIAKTLYNYAAYKNLDQKKSDGLSSFSDASSVSSWAKDSVSWAVAEGIIGGSNGKLNPQADASRAQVATMIERFAALDATVEQPAGEKPVTPEQPSEAATLLITGSKVTESTFTVADLQAHAKYTTVAYSGRNKENNNARQTFQMGGVALTELLALAKVQSGATSITVTCDDGYTKVYKYEELLADQYSFVSGSAVKVPTLLAVSENGAAYNAADGNPFRLVIGQADWDDDQTMDFNMQYWAKGLKKIVVE